MDNSLIKFNVKHLLKFADTFAGIEVHLPINGKFVRLNYANDQFVDILQKLQQKNVENVFINQKDCHFILEHISQTLSSKKTVNKEKKAELLEALNSAMENIKNIMSQLGIELETVKLIKVINDRAMSLLSDSPSIFSFVKDFKHNCSDEFLRAILTNYIMSLVVDTFPWSSNELKTKIALAAFTCDVVLNREDFQHLREWQKKGGELNEKVRSHPEVISCMLKEKRSFIPHETITIIEQHHERPNGTGFPHGITSTRFNQLSSIFIVCQQFTEELHDANYIFDKRIQILSDLQVRYDYSSCRVFRKALEGLARVVH